MGRYDRRVAVITGAARGIGFGIAQRLAREGASIAVFDLDLRSPHQKKHLATPSPCQVSPPIGAFPKTPLSLPL